jgi:hypothetical protein
MLKQFYEVLLRVGNDAGCGNVNGSLAMSKYKIPVYALIIINPLTFIGPFGVGTHFIQNVKATPNGTTVMVDVLFARNSSARGTYIVFHPEVWNKLTCENSVQLNLPKGSSNFILKNITVVISGVYKVLAYLIGSDGRPDRKAISAIRPETVVIEGGSSDASTPSQSEIVSHHRNATAISIKYKPPADRQNYIAILTNENDSTYEILDHSTDVEPETSYCLTVFSFNNGIIHERSIYTVHIPPYRNSTGKTNLPFVPP